MSKEQKIQLSRIVLSAIFFATAVVTSIPTLLLVAYGIAGYSAIFTALRNIFKGQIFDENFLMTVATAGALALRQWDEAVAVMLFYLVGEFFENYAVDKSRNSISSLMDLRPDYANLIENGHEKRVDPYDVSIGDIIIVKPGEKIPLDGVVIEGESTLDTMALTGESMPQDTSLGKDIFSGCVNLTGVLKIKVKSKFENSTVSKILDLVENAGSKKAKVEKFITKFARYYTPAVVFSALALAIIPPLLFSGVWNDWIYRALLFLVISCPCALVISVPLTFFGGVGAASKAGILVKGSNYLEALANVESVIFDKTGTLTSGTFSVTKVNGPEDLLKLAAYAEIHSNHPISLSIKRAYGDRLDNKSVSNVKELPGKGVQAYVEGVLVHAGNEKLMKDLGITSLHGEENSTIVHLAKENKYYGYIAISDTVKDDSKKAIKLLKNEGIKNITMLTGDNNSSASFVASTLGIADFHSSLIPIDKVKVTEDIISKSKGNVVFVGDGINDAPVLARADIGVAMGGLGSQAAIEAADIVIMDDSPSKLATVISMAKKTLVIAKENVVFALAVKGIILLLGALGFASMWMAIFADVGVTVIAILNAMRTMLLSKKS